MVWYTVHSSLELYLPIVICHKMKESVALHPFHMLAMGFLNISYVHLKTPKLALLL